MMCILLSWLQHNMEMLVTKITPQHKMLGCFSCFKMGKRAYPCAHKCHISFEGLWSLIHFVTTYQAVISFSILCQKLFRVGRVRYRLEVIT